MNVLKLENAAVLILQCKTSYVSKMLLAKRCIKTGIFNFLRCSVLMKYAFYLSEFSTNCLENGKKFEREGFSLIRIK